MAPHHRKKEAHSHNAEAGPSHKPRAIEHRDPSGVPGVSKLKASIRQTKRLLAKDSLEPGKRIATQRRLAALEADLAAAERRAVESKNGERYHKIKFFERQKLLRIIKRIRKTLDSSPADQRLLEELEQARVMLNYVLHYPNTQKYISLFPREERGVTGDGAKHRLALPRLTEDADGKGADQSVKRRREVLNSMRAAMGAGEMSRTPEDLKTEDRSARRSGVLAASGNIKKDSARSVKQAVKDDGDDFFDEDDQSE